MQSAAESKRNELRQKLQPYFKNYADHHNEIPTAKVESFVKEVLKQTNKQQIDYVIRNMFRVDADNSGKVSKNELRDFLFRRHCGQMSLQKAHRQDKIAKAKEHLINGRQFHTLINNSLHFLGVTIDQRLSSNLFRLADKDNDSHITYLQYFQIINDAFCDVEIVSSPPPYNPPKKVWRSKFRFYLQVELRRIYDKIILGKDLRELLGSTLSYQDQTTLYRLQGEILENSIASFAPFFNLFIVNLAIRGLRSFKDGSRQRTLNQSQFLTLLYNTFEILNIQRVKLSLVTEIFNIVDLNKDKTISYNEYLDWVHVYLGTQEIDEARYYLKADSDYYSQNILQPVNFINFTNIQFAIQTKQKLHNLIIPFDTNNDKILQNEQMINILANTLKSDQYQLQYFLSNLHRVNRGGVIGYQEFVHASLKYHYGEIINNRYHNSRRRSVWRIMNRQEFGQTLTSTLKAIRVQLSQQDLDIIWRIIDKQQYGWIHYDVYFYFLFKYFGIDYQDEWWERLQRLSVLERFKKIYFDQLTKGIQAYDQNNNKFYEQIQIKQIFKKYFCFQPYTSQTVLAYTYPYEKNLTLDTLIRIILEGYLVRFGVWNIRKGITKADWNRQTISQNEFVQTLWNHSFFLDRKPPRQDLIAIFRLLDKRNSGRITLREFADFIKSTLGIGIQQFKEEEQLDFDSSELAQLIWGELRQYFRDYDRDGSGFIDRSELGPFIKIVLGDQTKFGHALVFRNFGIKVDNNQDQMVSFTQFAPFAVSYAGQHALRTFHELQPKGRRLSLSLQQFISVVQSAFRFLRSFDRYKDRLRTLYGKLGKGSEISYVQYFSWLESAITAKIRDMKWVK